MDLLSSSPGDRYSLTYPECTAGYKSSPTSFDSEYFKIIIIHTQSKTCRRVNGRLLVQSPAGSDPMTIKMVPISSLLGTQYEDKIHILQDCNDHWDFIF